MYPTSSFPKGLYMSLDEVKKRTPSLKCSVIVEEQSEEVKVWMETNDYKLLPEGKCISQHKLKKKVWAYSDGEQLYINCRIVKLQSWYAKILTAGRFLAFYENRVSQNIKDAAVLGGLIGAHVAINSTQKPIDRYLQVIDLKESMRYFVDSVFVKRALAEHLELLQKFETEVDKNSHKTLLAYLQMINDIEAKQ
jgi:hypothetical protein